MQQIVLLSILLQSKSCVRLLSGTPTATGTFNYTIPLTGGCATVNALDETYQWSTAGTASTTPTHSKYSLTNTTHSIHW